MSATLPPLPPNVGRFIAFRVLFNARFYYPVLAVMFVDLGLTLEQYTLLNVAWAISIVVFELPLGALGDQVGYRPLVIGAAAVMVLEMSVLAFFRSDSSTLLFAVFLVNRVLSGLAEAAASGADEALAYDSMVQAGVEREWPDVLARLGRRVSVATGISMVVGAAVYDPKMVARILHLVGVDASLTQPDTVRLPAYLTLCLALGALFVSFRLREPELVEKGSTSARDTLREILGAGRWIAATPYVLSLVCTYFVVDSGVRLVLTLSSSYFRKLGIAASWFGVLSAAIAALGFLTPPLAERLVRRARPRLGFLLIACLVAVGLTGVGWIQATWGLVSVFVLAAGMHLLGFLISHYLNAATPSARRATVLSFKSLAGNVAYGLAGWGFALALRTLAGGEAPASGSPAELRVLGAALRWLPAIFAGLALPLLLWSSRLPEMRRLPDSPRAAP